MPLIIYTFIRLAAIIVCALGLYAAGARSSVLWLLAIIIGMMVSYLLFRGPRDNAARYLQERAEQRKSKGERFGPAAALDADYEDSLGVDSTTQSPDTAGRSES
ncbi:DUF4229 domain-containing protein [Jonesia quinghaiensis]|uniref:DUF4229 domain-containing protein n=1 Tax=Jonesia quinghaiensis TaxID=262806 RepID=UPI0009FE9EF7|nr:DUF4229 domain-containing protein [Jonesia quinghaiensis]